MLYLFISKMIKVKNTCTRTLPYSFYAFLSGFFDSLLLQFSASWFISHHLIWSLTSLFIICFSFSSLAYPLCLPLHSLKLLGSHNSTPRHVSLALMLAALNLCLFFSSKWQQPCFKTRCFPFWLTGNVYVEIWRLCDICQKLRNTI